MTRETEVGTITSGLWFRSESRQVRPFRYVDGYLRNAQLRLYRGGEFTSEESIPVDYIDISRLAPTVRVSRPPEAFEDLVGIPLNQLKFIVLLEDSFFKMTSTLHESRLEEISAEPILIDPDCARAAASWQGETRIHLAVILTENRQPRPGHANRPGSWISRKTFRITKPINTSVFPVEPVDEQWFIARKLPATTPYFVQINDDDFNQPSSELPTSVKVYANASLVEAMARNESSSSVRALERLIYVDVVTTVLMSGLKDLNEEPNEGTVLDLVINRISEATKMPRERIISAGKAAGGSELRSMVQAEADLNHAMIAAARRNLI